MNIKYLVTLLILSFQTIKPVAVFAQHIPKDVFLTLKNVNIVDVEKGVIQYDHVVVIKNDIIVSISKSQKSRGSVVDLKHRFLVPGLVDSHVHVTNISGSPIEHSYHYLEYLLKHGVTTVRDPMGNGAILKQVQHLVNNDLIKGADIYFAAFMAGDWYFNRDQGIRNEPYHAWEQRIVPGTNLDSAMKAAKSCGATGIKLYHSFDGHFLKEVVTAAKKNQLMTWGHAMMYPARPLEVIGAGVEVISHASMLSALINDPKINYRRTPQSYKDSIGKRIDVTPLANEMKKRNVILDATLTVSEVQEEWIFDVVKKLHQQGVKISAGTDKITVLTNAEPHIFEELGYFVNNCGFTPADALKAATLISAETIGQQKNIGSIAVGKKADLLVVDQNPLDDINRLKVLNMVIKHGKIFLPK